MLEAVSLAVSFGLCAVSTVLVKLTGLSSDVEIWGHIHISRRATKTAKELPITSDLGNFLFVSTASLSGLQLPA